MGTGGSFLRQGDEDDVLGTEFGSSQGVIKRIPIEVKPRGKLGLRSVGSQGKKPKGGSLRSALSVDLENPEVERIRKDFEMYRLNKENEISNMQKKEKKMEQENRRLRAELQALQKTYKRMREERELAQEAEHQALIRAAAFESDRDKIQRQFKIACDLLFGRDLAIARVTGPKAESRNSAFGIGEDRTQLDEDCPTSSTLNEIFRETKENEIQTLLRARRDLETRLSKATGNLDADVDAASRMGAESLLGAGNPGDWWTALESEPSLGSTTQLYPSGFKGPEFAQSMIELDGPFTNVNKDDWNAAAASLAHIIPTIPESIQTNRITVYVCCTADTAPCVETLYREYEAQLMELVGAEGRFFNIIFMPSDDLDPMDTQVMECQRDTRARRIDSSTIFVGFVGRSLTALTDFECRHGHLESPGSRHAIFCLCHDPHEKKGHNPEAEDLRKRIIDSGNSLLMELTDSPAQAAEFVFSEIENILKQELGIERREREYEAGLDYEESEGPEMLCGGCVWDPKNEFEQVQFFHNAAKSTCEFGFEKFYERLHAHISAPGPLPPFLIAGESGSGRSLLLAKWIDLQMQRAGGNLLVLYHFVGSCNSCSTDPALMIRRFTAQLMQHVTSPPTLTCDPIRLMEEFPRWLEKVSSKLAGGVIIVIDGIDRFPQGETQLKWLLDPLPVDSRVVVSVDGSTCPVAWQSWPTLYLSELSNKSVKELLRAELASLGSETTAAVESRILTHCRMPATCTPLYVVTLAAELASCPPEHVDSRLDLLLETVDSVKLYKVLIDAVRQDHENADTRGRLKMTLKLVLASRNGISETELFTLIPGMTWNFWSPLCDALIDRQVLTFQSGLLVPAHDQVRLAIEEKYFGDEDGKSLDSMRRTLRDYFAQFQTPPQVTYRVADELPWLNKQLGDKEALQSTICNLCVFVKLFGRGRCGELIGYWQFLGMDKGTMAKSYFGALKQMEQMVGEYDGMVTLPRVADVYEALGRFLRDLGLLVEALTPLQRALEIRETALDPDHPSVAQTLHQVAGLHAQQGKFVTAEALYKQALDIYEGAYGRDHYLIARELDALSVLYQKQGKHDLAEPLHKRAMSIRRKSKAPRIASGQIRGIDPLRRRVLQLEELAMGPDSPDLARTLNELGVLYYLQNNVETAESFFMRALEMRESLLGSDHPDLAQSLNNLAALYNDRKQYGKAEPLYVRALAIRQKHCPSDNQRVASVVNHLAMLYKKMNKMDKALPLYRQSVDIRERSLGPNHPSVATALVNLAVLYSQEGNHEDALPLYEKALKIYEDSFGPTHPRVAETLKNMALLKYEQGDYQKAAQLYKRATDIKENDANYAVKVTSRRSSTADTVSTLKHMGAQGQFFD